MLREKIELSMSMEDILITMSEGNVGALTVLTRMLQKKEGDGFFVVLGLDDMNIRGEQVWVGYKDHCGENLDAFIQKVKERDSTMVDTINKVCGNRHVAVESGASYGSD